MALGDAQRRYNLTDGQLCMFTSNLCNTLTRDLTDLGTFGVTAPKIAALKALGDAFEIFTTDEVYLANLVGATENKNSLMSSLKEAIRNMALRCQIKWGVKSFQLKSLGITGMNDLIDDSLLVVARRVLEQMTLFLPDLSAEGLTQDKLDDFEDLISETETAMNTQKNKINERENKSFERITNGNELYDEVVKYCEIGKRVFAMSNPAKYNDYIIYTTSSPGSLTAPTDLYFSFPSRTFSWSEVENATSYQLEWSIDGEEANYVEIYSGADTSFTYNDIASPLNYLRVRARNANGFGPFSDILEQGYFITLPPPVNLNAELLIGTTGTIKLTFDAVPSASVYKIYRSTANVGDVAGSFVYAGQSAVNEFEETLALGHRYYYRCTAENQYQTSTNSGEVWIEL